MHLATIVEMDPTIKPAVAVTQLRMKFPDLSTDVTDKKIKSKVGNLKTQRKTRVDQSQM